MAICGGDTALSSDAVEGGVGGCATGDEAAGEAGDRFKCVSVGNEVAIGRGRGAALCLGAIAEGRCGLWGGRE